MSPFIMTQIPPILVAGMFWLALLVALVGAAWWVLRAGARGGALESDRADLEVYQDQIAEIERDLAQGRISEEAAQAGKLEIGRRLVQARDRILDEGPRLGKLAMTSVAAVIALGAVGLYLIYGSPQKTDQPFVQREAELLSRPPETLSEDEIMLLLQEQAKKAPEDPMPHALMAQVLGSAGRDQDALRAFQAAIRRDPKNADLIAETGAVLMRLNEGVVGADAKSAFDAALQLKPNSVSARFYLGLADWQAGKKTEALAAWRTAYSLNDKDAEGQMQLVTRVADILSQLDRGPGEEADPPMAAMANAGPDAQKAFIETMIAKRIDRLAENPSDPSLRLSAARVLLMTGKLKEARDILLVGQKQQASDPLLSAVYSMALESAPASPAKGTSDPALMPKR
ncbi:MAG: c-type cytochrome biogenesis protein CcmI [Aquidulcibacter sp.]|uniref:c-type cytochrome biogenesis protein CcmI n=1 Tax=Aquidulcibacter sp. TaxID=2052990 RepID=UPI0022BB1C5E|nr:c-type cytochrome biogenesis protein CcmI [Aquidulcibacter sp.]